MKKFVHDNALSLIMFGLFFVFLLAQIGFGFNAWNEELQQHRQPEISLGEYLTSGHFIEAVFENWESEFLQMGSYVVFTSFLIQKGSPESKDPDKDEPEDFDNPDNLKGKQVPWPVRKGGLILKLYENSLSLSLFALFLLSFGLHLIGSARVSCQEEVWHGGQCDGTLATLGKAEFWFQSFQNWQSEFLSVGVLVVLSIYLRQKGSPESKPVAAPNSQTGT